MLCPTKCGNRLQFVSSGVSCACGYSLACSGDILDLLGSSGGVPSNTASYCAATARGTFQQLDRVLQRIGKKNIPVTVEFGAGDGAWMFGMDQSERFHEVYGIDISFRCRAMVGKTHANARTHLIRQLPEKVDFEQESVDLVVGRSVLRHVPNYEGLLANFARWLKRDGAAIFYEPCIQGKIWIALLVKLIREIDEHPEIRAADAFPRDAILSNLEKLYEKDFEQPPRLAEAKWIFDVDILRETARDVGFSMVQIIDDDGRLLTAFKRQILAAIRRPYLRRREAQFAAFGDVFSNSAPKMLLSPMVFFVFRKLTLDDERMTKQKTGGNRRATDSRLGLRNGD